MAVYHHENYVPYIFRFAECREGDRRRRNTPERRTDVLNISMTGMAGAYAESIWTVEPAEKTGQEGRQDSTGQQEQQERPGQQSSFGEMLEKEFMDTLPSGVCPNCGSPVYNKPKGRPKIYCSDACRFKWKNRHPKPENWKSTRKAVCPYCGREFLASREYQGKRIYCSRACANRARAEARKAEAKLDENRTGGEQ